MSAELTAGEIAERLDIRQLWRVLSLPGEPGKCVSSPFREDKRPSFSVYEDGGRWRFKDHAASEDHGDAVDFIRLAKGCTAAEALAWARNFLGLPDRRRREDVPASGKKRWMPDLRPGSLAELNHLAELRGFGVEALRLAERRGFFGFAEFAGTTCWAVKDRRRMLMEFRRLDGQMFAEYKGLPARKSHCIGSGKAWPLGIEEAAEFSKVAWLEGAADFLAVFNFLVAEAKEDSVAPVAMLGASNQRIAEEALHMLVGKCVVLYPHCDEAGQTAAREWARQLHGAGARVRAFDLAGLVKADGTLGKDLADVCKIAPECFELERKFRRVLP
jgi:hypothetical protein